jgi:hypothetical protein
VPLARYFIFVGGILAALLFIGNWCLPTPPPMFAVHQHDIDRTIIRIRSARKWPEKVVLDTSHTTMAPRTVEEAAAAQSVRLASDEAGNQSKLEAMARLKPDAEPPAFDRPALQVKRGAATNARSKRRIAHRLARAEPDGGCCLFGRIDNRQAFSNAARRWDAVSSWPMEWPTITRRN